MSDPGPAALIRQTGQPGRLAHVLLIEDDPEDAMLPRRALERSRLALEMTWVESGEQGLACLRARADPTLAHLPVVILPSRTG